MSPLSTDFWFNDTRHNLLTFFTEYIPTFRHVCLLFSFQSNEELVVFALIYTDKNRCRNK